MIQGRRIALLDLDGTLTDPRDGLLDCLRHAFAQVGRSAPSELELLRWIGPPLAQSFASAMPDCAATAARALAAYRERFDAVGWRANRPVAGIETALIDLGDTGFECHVATSKPAVFAQRIVSHFRLDRWIGGVFGSGLDGRLADKPSLLAHVMRRLNARPTATVMVGDRCHDMAGAAACGIPGVGVLWGFGDRDELHDAHATAIVEHPGQLAAACTDALNARRPGPGSPGLQTHQD